MNEGELAGADAIDSLLRMKGEALGPQGLRRFANECCRRISLLGSDSIWFSVLEFAEHRASGLTRPEQFDSLRRDYSTLYDSLYAGQGAPSAAALALAAVGEVAFTESALAAATNAAALAAEALAIWAASTADDAQYDEVHDATYRDERQAQRQLLEKLIDNHSGG